MKNVKFTLFVALISFLLCGCGTAPAHSSADAHDHEVSATDDHDGHDHQAPQPEQTADAAATADAHDHADEIIFTPQQASAAGLQTEVVAIAPFSRVIKTSGQIASAAGDMATIAATSSGLVSFVNRSFSEGAAVSKGETLVTISSSKIADGDVVAKSKAAYEAALKAYERGEKMAADAIISQKELEQLRLTCQTAKISYDALGGNIASNGGVRVTSPMSGYVQSRLVNQGEYVSVGTPIATIVQNRRVQLRAEVSEKYFGELATISTANFRTPYNDHLYKISDMNGRLLSFGKASGESSFYIPVVFEMDNVGSIVPGSFVEVYLLSAPGSGTISVPREAIVEQQGIYYVFVQLDEEGFQKREVKTGADNGDRIEILGGLKDGERVVTKGATQVRLAATSSVIPEGHVH